MIFLAIYIVNISFNGSENKNSAVLIFVYILIGLTSESTVVNFGSELAIILAIVSSNFGSVDKNKEDSCKLNKGKVKALFLKNK